MKFTRLEYISCKTFPSFFLTQTRLAFESKIFQIHGEEKKVDFDASITAASILKEFFIFYNKVKHISIRIKEIFPEKQEAFSSATLAKSKMLSQHFPSFF